MNNTKEKSSCKCCGKETNLKEKVAARFEPFADFNFVTEWALCASCKKKLEEMK
jgi:hypothetical protein